METINTLLFHPTDNCYDIVCLPLECQEGAEPGTQRPDKCCLDRSDCVCNSALCPAPPNCGSDSVPKVVAAADEANGQCCNKYVCKLGKSKHQKVYLPLTFESVLYVSF